MSYNFTKKQDVLASDKEDTAYDISVDFLDKYALNRFLQD